MHLSRHGSRRFVHLVVLRCSQMLKVTAKWTIVLGGGLLSQAPIIVFIFVFVASGMGSLHENDLQQHCGRRDSTCVLWRL